MRTLLIVLSLILTQTLFAQDRFMAGANFIVGNPQGEFERATDNKLLYGLGLQGFAGFGWFQAGFEFNYLYRGGETFRRAASLTLPVNVEVDVTNQVVNGHFVVRLQPNMWIVQPYIEGFLGGAYFSTVTSIREDENRNENILDDTTQDDFTISRGYGAGLMVKVYEGDIEGYQSQVFVDFKLRDILGNDAKYLNSSKDVVYNEESQVYETNPSQSKTDMLLWQFGVMFIF